MKIIEEHSKNDSSLFLYVAFQAIHAPLEVQKPGVSAYTARDKNIFALLFKQNYSKTDIFSVSGAKKFLGHLQRRA